MRPELLRGAMKAACLLKEQKDSGQDIPFLFLFVDAGTEWRWS
jgi:hypothetical protein